MCPMSVWYNALHIIHPTHPAEYTPKRINGHSVRSPDTRTFNTFRCYMLANTETLYILSLRFKLLSVVLLLLLLLTSLKNLLIWSIAVDLFKESDELLIDSLSLMYIILITFPFTYSGMRMQWNKYIIKAVNIMPPAKCVQMLNVSLCRWDILLKHWNVE